MRIKAPFLLLLLISFFSCDKTDDKIPETPISDDPKEEPVLEDEKSPELTVSGFTDILETISPISVSIVDESTVETKVMHNGEEIAASADKQFEITINPYVIPVGSTEYIIVSIDAKGNETSETFTTEIKHLLMTYNHSAQEGESDFDRYIFLNDLEGNELNAFKPTVGESKIYTDEIIEDDKVLFSVANFNGQVYDIGSYKSLFISTYEIPLGKSRSESNWINWVTPENTVTVKLNDVPFTNYSPTYIANATDYYTSNYDGDEQQTTLNILHRASGPMFIRTNGWGGSTLFDGKKENYRYMILDPEAGDTSIEVEAEQFVMAGNSLKLDIPEHDLGSLSFNRSGFEGIVDGIVKTKSVYEMNQWSSTEIADYIDLPIFELFDDYDNYISYSKNGNYFNSRGKNDAIELEMPNWTASSQVNETNVELAASNQDVDYYALRLRKYDYSTSDSKNMNWSFYISDHDSGTKTMARLELPELISEELADTFFGNDGLEQTGLSAMDYVEYDSYDEIIEWLVFNIDSPIGIVQYKQISFDISNTSGKSTTADRPWDLDKLHRYGLNAKGEVKNRR